MSCSNCNKPAPDPLPDTWAAGNDEVLCPGCFDQRGSRAIEYSYRDEHGAQTGIWQGSPAVALQAAIEHLGAVRLFAYRDKDGMVWCLTTEVLMTLGAALRAGVDPDAAYDSWCHDADCVAYPDGDVGQLLADEEVGEPGYIGNSVSPELRQFPFQDALVSRPLGTTGTADATTESWMRRRLTDEVVTSDGRCAKCGGELISMPVFEDPSATFSFCPGCQPRASSEPVSPPPSRHVRIAEQLKPGPFSPDAHAARLRGAGKIGVLQGLYMDPDIYMVRLPDEPTDDPVAFYLASELELTC